MTAMADATPQRRLDEDRDWFAWVQQNARGVAFGGVALLLLVLGFWWFKASSARKEAFAAQALDQARAAADAGNLPLAASDLARVVDRFSGTNGGNQAAILLAQIRLSQGQTEQAVNGLQTFLASRRPDHVEAAALGLLGTGFEEQGKLREAGEAYRRASASAPLDFLKAQYLIDAGRALAASGDTAGARAALDQVLRQFGRLDQAAEARVRMAELGGDVPPPPPPEPQN
jgi:predicted negative regulator of RcsB-dependent stress response